MPRTSIAFSHGVPLYGEKSPVMVRRGEDLATKSCRAEGTAAHTKLQEGHCLSMSCDFDFNWGCPNCREASDPANPVVNSGNLRHAGRLKNPRVKAKRLASVGLTSL